jgi:MFS family permease
VFLLGLLLICIASVPLAGGRLGSLSRITFKRPAAGVLALALQVTIMRFFPSGDPDLHAAVHLFTYGLMFYFLAANLSLPGLWLIGLGGGLNAFAIAANNGVMPAHPDALATAGILQVPGEFANSAAVADPKLWFLGDIFALPADWPMANVFSVGDICLVAGAFVLLHRQSRSMLAPLIERLTLAMRRSGPQTELVRDNRAFRRLWIAQTISSIGDWIYPLAVFTYVVADDAKASSLAFLLIAQVGPGMLVGTFGGPLIDRFSRKSLMFFTDVGRAAAIATLLFSPSPSLMHLYAVALAIGVGSALNQPAFQACLPNILPSRQLAGANALVGITMSLAVTVGPLIGALVVDQFGVSWGFTANAISFAFSAALVWGTDMPARTAVVRERFTRELADGFKYVAGHRSILAVVVVVGLITFAAGIKSPLEPLFALESLNAGATGLGLMGAVWGLGMFIGAGFASRADHRMGHGPLLTWSVAVVAIAVFAGAASPTIGPVLLLWGIAGVANTLGTVAYETLLQEETPDSVRGRVFAAVEAALQAGLLAGVGAAAAAEAIFGNAEAARAGMMAAGVLFGVAALASGKLLHRIPGVSTLPARRRASRTGCPPAVRLRDFEVLPSGGSLALLRVATVESPGAAPVLLLDDGSRVHRLEPLPGANCRSWGYGVPTALLSRAALALELRGGALLELPRVPA